MHLARSPLAVLWQRHGSWVVSVCLHAAMLGALGLVIVPYTRGTVQVQISSRFAGDVSQQEFDTSFEAPSTNSNAPPTFSSALVRGVKDAERVAAPFSAELTNHWGPASVRLDEAALGSAWDHDGQGLGSGFFGVAAGGNRFVYVVDCSGSMEGARFRRACNELERSLERLRPNQEFFVIFYNHLAHPMPMPGLVKATRRNLKKVRQWVDQVRPFGNTNPGPALEAALSAEPDAIYLLSDGLFDPAVVEQVRQANKGEVVVHAIGFEDPAGEPVLKALAEQSGGQYRFVR